MAKMTDGYQQLATSHLLDRHAFLQACVVNASVQGVVTLQQLKDELTGVSCTTVPHQYRAVVVLT